MRTIGSTSRRSFLGQIGGVVGTSVLCAGGRDELFAESLAAVQAEGAATQHGEEFWKFLRQQFLFEPGLIYLNSGTTGAMPRPVFEASVRFLRMLAENPKNRQFFEGLMMPNEVRRKAAALIGAELEETALTRNTTEGINIVAHGLPLKAGDQVLLTNQEHAAGREPWRLRAKRDGIEVTEVNIPTPCDAATFLNRFEAAITSRTRVIATPHIPTTTGMITPAREICALARSKGILTLLDGAHCSGQIRINVKDLGCDFYATSPHKWLHAPLGNGIFYVRQERQDMLWPLNAHGGWDTHRDARRYTTFGNRSWSSGMALGDAIDFANAIGIDRIEARQRTLMTDFKRQLLALPGVEPLTSSDPALYCAQSAFRIPKLGQQDVGTFLREKHNVIVGGGRGRFRVDIAYFISPQELEKTVEIFDSVIRKGVTKATSAGL